jgi:hypothetical protein
VASKAPWFDITDGLPQYPDAYGAMEEDHPQAVT